MFSNLISLTLQVPLPVFVGCPDRSVGKESACNAGDPGLFPWLGRSPGEGTGYPLQYSWVSLVDQLVKNSPAMQETWVWSLGWEDPLAKWKATHSSILAWRIPWTVQSMESQRVGHDWVTFTFTFFLYRSLTHWCSSRSLSCATFSSHSAHWSTFRASVTISILIPAKISS